jgi:hypothetical protein
MRRERNRETQFERSRERQLERGREREVERDFESNFETRSERGLDRVSQAAEVGRGLCAFSKKPCPEVPRAGIHIVREQMQGLRTP